MKQKMTMIQYKKILKEEIKNLSTEEKVDKCYRVSIDRSNDIALRRAAISLFCSYVDIYDMMCGMANKLLPPIERKFE